MLKKQDVSTQAISNLLLQNDTTQNILKLIDRCQDINANVDAAKSLLSLAVALAASPEVVDRIIKAGAFLDHKDDNGYTPLLYLAIKKEWTNSDFHNLRLLLDAGADVNAVNTQGKSPIIALAKKKHLELDAFTTLIGHSPDVNHVDGFGNFALKYVVMRHCYDAASTGKDIVLEIAKLLLNNNAKVNQPDRDGVTALLWACSVNDDIRIVEFLLSSGADVNITDISGSTALICALKFGWEEKPVFDRIKVLLLNGANVNAFALNGLLNPLHLAMMRYSQKTVDILLHAGALYSVAESSRESWKKFMSGKLSAKDTISTDATQIDKKRLAKAMYHLLDEIIAGILSILVDRD